MTAETKPPRLTEREARLLTLRAGRIETLEQLRRDVDMTQGDIQCPEKLRTGRDVVRCCRFLSGHAGKNQTFDGIEWDHRV